MKINQDPFELLLKAAGVAPGMPPKKKTAPPDEEEEVPEVPEQDGAEDASQPVGEPVDNASVPGEDDEGMAPDDGAEEDGDVDDDGTPDAQDDDADGDDIPDAEDADFGAGTDDLQTLYSEIAEAEKAYYASRGFHGAGHHKAEAALDTYHKVIRKMVRALTGATGEAPEQEMPVEGEDDPTAQQPDGDAEGDGDGEPEEGVDEAQFGDEGEGAEEAPEEGAEEPAAPAPPMSKPATGMAVGKPHKNAGKPQPVAAPPAGGAPGAPPEKKKGKPFGKSDSRALRKGLYAYDSSAGVVPEKFLFEYLCGFVEEAYEHEARESTHARFARNVDYMAARVLHELVMYIPRNRNLARAATKYPVNVEALAAILREKRIIAVPDNDGAERDRDSHTAMGHYDIPRSVDPIMRSMSPKLAAAVSARPWVSPDVLARGAEGVRAAASRHRDGTRSVIDDTADPSQRLAKSHHRAQRDRWNLQDAAILATVDNDCPLHGPRDLTKSQNLANPYVRCSCPRS